MSVIETDGDWFERLHQIEREIIAKRNPSALAELDREWEEANKEDSEE